MSTTTIQIRIDSKIKKQAKKTLEEIGLDLSSGIKLFLTTVVSTQSVPFTPRTVNGFTLEQEREMLRQLAETRAEGKTYTSIEELHADILAEPDDDEIYS